MKLRLLFCSILLVPVFAAAAAVKWHPGHYVFIAHNALTPEVLALPHFRGVQKIYTWREFEPEKGRYDFSTLRADLALAKKHDRQLVAQFTFIAFTKDSRSIPDYIRGPEFGGGVYATVKGAFNPVIWNRQVAERLGALLVAFGREFDRDPNLEAVNLPETSTSAYLDRTPQEGVETYTDAVYFEALKQCMTTLRRAFPNTVVIQYTNFPTKLLPQLTDYEKEIGVGMGGPDVYPRPDAVNDPEKGVYHLYAKLAGTVPMGAAVQQSNYAVAYKKRSALKRGQTMMKGAPIVITPGDEVPIPVREHLQLAREKLKLNYLFWADSPKKDFEKVKIMLAEPDLAGDPADGLETKLPPKAFLR